MSEGWRFFVDRGGTFTDCLGLDPEGRIHVVKVLSSDLAPLVGIRRLLGLSDGAPIPPCEVRMGTTVATNALLERRGVPTALVITRGFGDALEIGDQTRPDLFALAIERPTPLHARVVEVDARCSPAGLPLRAPDDEALVAELAALADAGIRSAAVVVLHGHAGPALEAHIGALAERAGLPHVSLSHEVNPEPGLVARGDTTLVDAYLTPLLRDYVDRLLGALPGSSLRVMQSSGGLVDARSFRGHNAILSGPAGGGIALARISDALGLKAAIGLDMGGTSTDVARYGGEIERVYRSEVAGVRIRSPMMAIHTVAAGGGSICDFDGYRLTVGPRSAGARPGPLCYGDPDATELTLTDIDLWLGRLQGDRFPLPLRIEPVREKLEALRQRMADAGIALSTDEIASGFFEIANAHMAEAIRSVSLARGHDVREHALVVFGGAAGQHATALAERLGVRRIAVHPLSGVLSALGMGLADVAWHGEADAGRALLDPEALSALAPAWDALEASAREALGREGFAPDRIALVRRVDLRHRGTETDLTVPFSPDAAALRQRFDEAHERLFGYARPEHPVALVAARVEAVGRAGHDPLIGGRTAAAGPAAPIRRVTMWSRGAPIEGVPVHLREELGAGTVLHGPAVVLEATGTLAIDPGFSLTVHPSGVLLLEAAGETTPAGAQDATLDPIRLELFGNRFASIAEAMGRVLQRTAISTNIRERLDFSCALFDGQGRLVANAPHIPVHLGAMSESVRCLVEDRPDMGPGDVFVTNDPARGGSHLPDITVVSPVFSGGELLFFTASRGHHADVGGTEPGSMPPASEHLWEEGVVLRALRAVHQGRLDEDAIRRALTEGPHPARNIDENRADLAAQIAANTAGQRLLAELIAEVGLPAVSAYMAHVQDNARARTADAIEALPDGVHRFADALDDGTPIVATVTVRGRRMEVDFEGTGPQVRGNLNAPRAVTVAAVLYVLRCLVGEPIPLNSGCLDAVTLRIPPGSVLDPDPDRAVAGGNVETSQRVVDVLLGALGRAAASQGTMNNLAFGDGRRLAYYETIAGGAGATPERPGASAVHTHMTNTRITDPEILEARFPVRVEQFAIRRGSGGRGLQPGGDGVIRELSFTAPMQVSLLSERRTRAPFGLAGGGPGLSGRNLHNGALLPGRAALRVAAGDRIRIETPGGGGFGSPGPEGIARPK